MMQVGAQLFTLRDYTQTAKDLDFSLGQVARMATKPCRFPRWVPSPPDSFGSCATSTA